MIEGTTDDDDDRKKNIGSSGILVYYIVRGIHRTSVHTHTHTRFVGSSSVFNGRLSDLYTSPRPLKSPSVRFSRRSPCTSKSRRKCLISGSHADNNLRYVRARHYQNGLGQVLIGPAAAAAATAKCLNSIT